MGHPGNVFNELLDAAAEIAAKAIENVGSWIVSAMIRYFRQCHAVNPRGIGDLNHRNHSPLAKLLLRKQFLQAKSEHGSS